MAKTQGPTYAARSKLVRVRKTGFMKRMSTKGGIRVIKRRRLKGRWVLTESDVLALRTAATKNKLFKRRR